MKNFINNTHFFEWDQATYNSYFNRIKDAVEITIPKLNEMACEQVELASVPFLTFVANKGADDEAANYSFVLRGYVRHWLGNVWGEFDRIKLTDLVGPASRPRAAAKNSAPAHAIGLDWTPNSPDIAPMHRTPVFIVCSPRPRVGKTLIARLLDRIPAAEARRGRGLRHQSGRAVAARLSCRASPRPPSVDDTFGEMPLFDRLIVNDGDRQGGRPRLSRLRRVLHDDRGDRLRAGGGAARRLADHPVRRRSRPRLGAGLRDAAAALPRPRWCRSSTSTSCAASCRRRSPRGRGAAHRRAVAVPEGLYRPADVLVHRLPAQREGLIDRAASTGSARTFFSFRELELRSDAAEMSEVWSRTDRRSSRDIVGQRASSCRSRSSSGRR